MAHNFIERIDIDGDSTGNTPIANTTFISVDGSPVNVGTDPNLPKSVLDASSIPTGFVVIGSDQTYQELPLANKTYIGDGVAILDGEGVRGMQATGFGGGLRLENLHLLNFIHAVGLSGTQPLTFNNADNRMTNCIFESNDEFSIRNTQPVYSGKLHR